VPVALSPDVLDAKELKDAHKQVEAEFRQQQSETQAAEHELAELRKEVDRLRLRTEQIGDLRADQARAITSEWEKIDAEAVTLALERKEVGDLRVEVSELLAARKEATVGRQLRIDKALQQLYLEFQQREQDLVAASRQQMQAVEGEISSTQARLLELQSSWEEHRQVLQASR
ncbi:unnamed protein product, partial [Polarella glacialis]